MTEKITKVYEGEWIIEPTPNEYKSTPSFKPLPDADITFCFEAFYQQVSSASFFKLRLVKLAGEYSSPTLGMIVHAKVCYSDGTVFKDYQTQPSQKIDTMTVLNFHDDIRNLQEGRGFPTTHGRLMRSNKLILKCKMAFSFYNQLVSITSESALKTKCCNKHLDLIRNMEKMYEPSTLSDFTFKVGDKTFHAHKFVLAAHSPVFQQMMIHEFQETNTNSATITDSTPEIFDLFLRSLYSGDFVDKSFVSVKELYFLADKYDVGFLKTECTELLISLLSKSTVCEVLLIAYKFCDSDLKTAAVNYAVKHIKDIVGTEYWEDIVKNNTNIAYDVAVKFIPK